MIKDVFWRNITSFLRFFFSAIFVNDLKRISCFLCSIGSINPGLLLIVLVIRHIIKVECFLHASLLFLLAEGCFLLFVCNRIPDPFFLPLVLLLLAPLLIFFPLALFLDLPSQLGSVKLCGAGLRF